MIHAYNDENIEDLCIIGDSNLDYVFTSNEDDALMLRISEDNLDSSTELARSKSSMKGRWLFDENSGTTASNTAYDLTVNDAVLYGDAARISGHSDTAVRLDGTNDYIAIKDLVFDRDDYEECTATTWIKTSDLGYQTILSYDNNQYFALTTKNNDLAGKLGCEFMPQADTNIVSCASISVVTDGNWHHVASVFDHGQIRLYVDGIRETTVSTDDIDFGTGTNRYGFIGDGSLASSVNGTRNSSDFDGDIDEVHLFMKAMTDNQIQRLYEFGSVNYSEFLFRDTFTNSSGSLAGTLPDETPDGETWTGGWTRDGSAATLNRDGAGGFRNAFLDFVPESGAIYEFSVDYEITSAPSTDAGFGIGFVTSESTTAGIFNLDAASIRVLENGSGQIGMVNGTVGNLQELSTLGINGTLTIVLDATPANWTTQWKFNQGVLQSGAFYSNPTNITDIAIHGGDADIIADDLKLIISIP